ncbi:MAG: serine hydrolase domain-containing protein [Vicinamibacterales bacterium]
MSSAVLRVVLAAILVWSAPNLCAQEPVEAPPAVPEALAAELDQALAAWALVPGHRGVTASVVWPDGAQWRGAAGIAAAGEALRPDHLVGIASITKTMTAAVILQLVDEGVLQLDDPLERWLAPIANVGPAITIRQLLNHTNGLGNYTLSAALGAAIDVDRSRLFTAAELLTFAGPPRFAPGERTEYTNTAFLLLGCVAEAATGRPIVELYRQRLWTPLDLHAIFMPGADEPPAPVAVAAGRGGVFPPLDHLSLLSIGQAAFGLYADAATVAAWGHALFAGTVISAERQAEMRTLVPAAGNIPGETGAGLGIRGYHYLDRDQIGHSGGMAFGSSLLLFDPDTGVTVAVLMNQGQGAGHFQLAPQLLAIATRPRS